MTIAYLADCPEHLPVVATWIFDTWGHLIPGLTWDLVAAKLHGRLNRDAIPLTLVALQAGLPVGTASLIPDDMSTRPELGPWLASVYVAPEHRRQGIGSQLVGAAEGIARRLGVSPLYLFTPDRERFYARLGWSALETTEYRHEQVVIMSKVL